MAEGTIEEICLHVKQTTIVLYKLYSLITLADYHDVPHGDAKIILQDVTMENQTVLKKQNIKLSVWAFPD